MIGLMWFMLGSVFLRYSVLGSCWPIMILLWPVLFMPMTFLFNRNKLQKWFHVFQYWFNMADHWFTTKMSQIFISSSIALAQTIQTTLEPSQKFHQIFIIITPCKLNLASPNNNNN
jgi:hypothetical protein